MAEFIKLYNENPNPRDIDKVVNVLRNGGLIIYPRTRFTAWAAI